MNNKTQIENKYLDYAYHSAEMQRLLLFFLIILALLIRIVCWDLSQAIYRDTIGFIHNSCLPDISSFFHHRYQEPIHTISIRLVHSVLFPREPISKIPNPFTWEFSAFTVGMVFTILCLWLLFKLGTYIHSVQAGLWSAFFLAIQPYAVHYSINGLSELPFLFFILLSILFVIKAINGDNWLLLLAGTSAVFAFLTRKEAIVLPFAIICYLLILKNLTFATKSKYTFLFVLGIIITGGCYAAIGGRINWFVLYLEHCKKVIHLFAQQGYPSGKFFLASIWMTHKYQISYLALFAWIREAGFLPALLFFIFLLKRKQFTLNIGWGLLILASLFQLSIVLAQCAITTLFVSRYLFPSTVIVFPISAAVMATLINRTIKIKLYSPSKEKQFYLTIVIVILLIFIPMTMKRYFSHHRITEKQAAQWLMLNTNSHSIVISNSERIGFYSQRKFALIYRKGMKTRITYAVRSKLSQCYFALVLKKNKSDKFNQWLKCTKANNLQMKILRKFHEPKQQVILFKLKEKKK